MDVEEYHDLFNFLRSPDEQREWPSHVKTKTQKNNYRRKAKVFTLQDGTLFYNHRKHSLVRVIHADEKDAILKGCHTSASAGHQGVNRTAMKIRERYWWMGMQQDIVDYVQSCDKCQRENRLRKTPSVLHPIPVQGDPFSMVGLDLVGPLQETKKGNKYIAVLTDYLTKYVEVKALPSKNAEEICEFIIEVVCRHGCIKTLITDQGREFCNALNEELCQMLGIEHRVSAPYHPQTNGLTERFNQTLCSALAKYVNEKQDDWDRYLHQVAFAARTCQQKSTKETPFYLLYGRKAVLPVQVDIPTSVPNTEMSLKDDEFAEIYNDRVTSFVELIKARENAKESISKEQKKQKIYYDKRHGSNHSLQPGQKVLLKNAKRINRKGDKMAHRWIGPYTISTCVGKGVFKLVERRGVVNIKSIKPYQQNLQKTMEKPNGKHVEKIQAMQSRGKQSSLKNCGLERRRNKMSSTIAATGRLRPILPRRSKAASATDNKTAVDQHRHKNVGGKSKNSKLKELPNRRKSNTTNPSPIPAMRPFLRTSAIPNVHEDRQKRPQKRKRSAPVEETLPKRRRVAKHLKTYKEEDIMDVINRCMSLNFCPARTMSAMSLAQKHCPMMSFYLDSQRDNDDELDLCMQDLLRIVQSKKRQSLADPSQIVPGLMLASALFVESEKHATEAAKLIQTFEKVPLAEPVPSIMKTREDIHRYRVGGIVLKEEDFSTLDSQNWVNDKIIHSYLGLLTWQTNLREAHAAYVLPCFLAAKWESGDYSSWMFEKVPLHLYEVLLLPVCYQNHWFLMVGYPKFETIMVLDSLPNKQREERNISHWRHFMEARFDVDPETPLTWTHTPNTSSSQRDGNSCGVFVLMNAAAVLRKMPPQIMRQCHAMDYRVYVTKILLGKGREDSKGLACDLPFCASNYKRQVQCGKCLRWCHHACLGISQKDTVTHCIFCV